MIRFLLGLLLGAVFAFNGAEDRCDARIKGLFTPDDYRAMQVGPGTMPPVPWYRER